MEPPYTRISSLIQRLAIHYKTAIISLFFAIEISLAVAIFFGLILGTLQPSLQPLFFTVGRTFGKLTAYLLVLTLLPGILGRFRWFTTIRITLMLFRRQFGILTYLSGVVHATFVALLPMLTHGFRPLLIFEVYGLTALLLMLPLFLTSNDYSVRLLQTGWDKLHKLVYLALFFSALHTLTRSLSIGVLLMSVVILEALSYLAKYIYDHDSAR